MKKLSMLIALMLCITIGGVYATWTYAGTNDIADAYAEAKVTIANVQLSGAHGYYEITSNLVLEVDQNAPGDHTAKLVFGSNDTQEIYLNIKFTPYENGDGIYKTNAVDTEFYFTTTTTMEYKMDTQGNYSESGTPTPIFTFSNPSDGVFSPNLSTNGTTPFAWELQPDGSFLCTFNQTQLESMIQLSTTFVLDSKAEHDKFREALNGNILMRVTDGIITE